MSNDQLTSLVNKFNAIKFILNEQPNISITDKLDAIKKIINETNNNFENNIEAIERVLNEKIIMSSQNSDIQIELAKKRVVNKLLNLKSIKNDINQTKSQTILSDTDLIDDDMLLCGKINGKMLHINIMPINITIDLSKSISSAIMNNKLSLIDRLITKNIDIFTIQPDIMIMCVEMNRDELFDKLLSLEKAPIDTRDYRCVYQLAARGNLELIKNIFEKCVIINIDEVIAKILIQAILNNHVNILEHFLTKEAFMGAPEIMHSYFINSITHNADVRVIKFFVENGIDIRQENYLALYTAINLDRVEIIKYFYQKDPNIIVLLTEHQKEKFGLVEITEINQFIGMDKCCNIYYDNIMNGDKFFQCENEKHHFKEDAWKEWVKNKCEWICPFCFCPIKKILFINKNN